MFCGYLKADTAATLKLGAFLDSTDGNTAETGLTISQADVRLSKNGGNMAQKNESTACTHDELGFYDCPIDATDTNTEGRLDVIVHESGALQVHQTYHVLNANVFDALFAAATTDYLQVDTIQVEGADATDSIATEADISAQIQTDMQADPTDFPVNVMEVNGTAQTAGDLADLISAISLGTGMTEGAFLAYFMGLEED
jgi:hypothetical protein